MRSGVTSIQEVRVVQPGSLPDGDYPGIWGGYLVTVSIQGTVYTLHTVQGVRTPEMACMVHIAAGEVTVQGT